MNDKNVSCVYSALLVIQTNPIKFSRVSFVKAHQEQSLHLCSIFSYKHSSVIGSPCMKSYWHRRLASGSH